MKKLMIAFAVVAMAACSQAASIKWAFTSAANDDTYSGSTFYLIQAAALPTAADFAAAKDFDTWLKGATVLGSNPTGKKNAGTKKYSNGKEVTDAAITDKNSYYVLVVNSDKSEVEVSQLIAGADAVYDLDAQESAITTGVVITQAWTPVGGSIPEPTSAMLVLLGVAGLALRRRRA